MSEFINDQSREKRAKYICPCGFSSYDLMEFLKHPFMEHGIKEDEKNEKDLKGLKEEE